MIRLFSIFKLLFEYIQNMLKVTYIELLPNCCCSSASSSRYCICVESSEHLHSLKNGQQQSLRLSTPSHAELMSSVSSEYNPSSSSSSTTPQLSAIEASATEIRASMVAERNVVQDLLQSQDKDAHGFLPPDKADGNIRVMFENLNSLFSVLMCSIDVCCEIRLACAARR